MLPTKASPLQCCTAKNSISRGQVILKSQTTWSTNFVVQIKRGFKFESPIPQTKSTCQDVVLSSLPLLIKFQVNLLETRRVSPMVLAIKRPLIEDRAPLEHILRFATVYLHMRSVRIVNFLMGVSSFGSASRILKDAKSSKLFESLCHKKWATEWLPSSVSPLSRN